jgi:hypothetical protein
MAKRKDKTLAAARDGSLAVYDGQVFLGFVLEIGPAYASYTADGAFIGAFKTLVEASRSIEAERQA